MQGWPIFGFDFVPFILDAVLAGRGTAILGVAMVVIGGIVGYWWLRYSPGAILWTVVAALVEIIGWVVLVDLWLRERDAFR